MSNVLNGKRNEYTPDTQARVLAAVRALDYHPNRLASSLVRRRSGTLGVTFANQGPSLTDNPFLTNVLDGVVVAAQEDGYNVTLYSRLRASEEGDDVEVFLDRRIDGLCIVAPAAQSRLPALLAQTPLPFIVVGVEEPAPGVSWIDVDNAAGARLAMDRLFAAGHTRIGHLAGALQQKAAVARERVYRCIMRECGYPAPPEWTAWCGFNEPGAYKAALRMLSCRNRPTAIFAANDQIALGVLSAARDLGLCVPGELSVIGFDDIREAAIVRPALTTVRQPVHDIGYAAAKYLARKLRGEFYGSMQQHVMPALVERETVAPPVIGRGGGVERRST